MPKNFITRIRQREIGAAPMIGISAVLLLRVTSSLISSASNDNDWPEVIEEFDEEADGLGVCGADGCRDGDCGADDKVYIVKCLLFMLDSLSDCSALKFFN